MNIPVTLNYYGSRYCGILTKVSGAGNTSMFHITIDDYFYGRLRYSDFLGRWVFDKNNQETDVAYVFPWHVTDLANRGKLFTS